jgi:hypothetical protein
MYTVTAVICCYFSVTAYITQRKDADGKINMKYLDANLNSNVGEQN